MSTPPATEQQTDLIAATERAARAEGELAAVRTPRDSVTPSPQHKIAASARSKPKVAGFKAATS